MRSSEALIVLSFLRFKLTSTWQALLRARTSSRSLEGSSVDLGKELVQSHKLNGVRRPVRKPETRPKQ